MFTREETVTRYQLERQAASAPDEVFVTFEEGTSWTRSEALSIAYAAANVLRDAGVRQGDRLAILYQNGPEFIRAWWGAAALGAIVVPIHTGYRGGILEHLLRLSRPAAMVGDPVLMQALDAVVDRSTVPGVRLQDSELQKADISPPHLERPIESWDSQVYLMTSGTTGRSKLAACSYRHVFVGGCTLIDRLRGKEDTMLLDMPLFHGGSFRAAGGCLATGTRMAIRSVPRLSTYWEVAKEARATMSQVVGSMVDFLLAQPSRRAERDHSLRIMQATPLPKDVKGFLRRFGVAEMQAGYGSTEVPGSLKVPRGDDVMQGYCGRPQPGYHLRIVDENDIELPPGTPGELVLRHDHPWVIASEYVGNPAGTATAWRNGWFHTGDLMRQDAEGRFFFVDRVKDALRRRGENISSVEVEAEVLAHPGVAEAACVPHRLGASAEDEVKVWIVPRDGSAIDFEALLRFCVARLPYFMVPRFFEITDELPKTHTGKTQKAALRVRGNGSQTWDREAQGIFVTRQGLAAREPQ